MLVNHTPYSDWALAAAVVNAFINALEWTWSSFTGSNV